MHVGSGFGDRGAGGGSGGVRLVAHLFRGGVRGIALLLLGTFAVVLCLAGGEGFLLLDLGLARLIHVFQGILDGIGRRRVEDLFLDDLVHLLLGVSELGDALADDLRDLGQLIGPEDQEAEEEDEKKLGSA